MIKKVRLPAGRKEERDVIREFLGYTKRAFFFAGFFSLFINILMLIPAIYMLAVYDIAVPSRSNNTLLFITILAVFLYIISGILQAIRGKLLIRVNNKLDYLMNKKVITSLFEFAKKHPTKATTQPANDFQQIKQFLTGATIFAFFDVPWVPIYMAVLYLFHLYYGIMGTAVLILILVITFANEYTTRKHLEKANESMVKQNRFLNHTVQNVEIIEGLGMKNRVYHKWLNLHNRYMSYLQKASDKGAFWSNLTKTTRIMSQSLMLGLGGYLAMNLEISSGMIVAGSIVLGRALAPIDLIINTWRNFSSARIAYKRLNQLLAEFGEEKQYMKLPEPEGHITLREVVVIPPDSKNPSLRNINMYIKAGETVAVIGPSGAGKSSLARTILGVWEPVNGKVEIDGADIKQWDREYLGKYLGYLPQDIELFEGTVAENIARFEDVDSDKVLEAAKLSGAHEIIVKLPDGYNTYLGPGGMTLSGGQRQRIGLARAVYGNPKIVVLDEPNSNLDDAGERALMNALVELKKRGTTIIVISHKINILNIVDKIAVLQEGILKNYGDAKTVLEQLMGKRG